MNPLTEQFPVVAAAERVYGPLAEAVGFGPARDAFGAWCEFATALYGEVIANAQVVAVLAAAGGAGMGQLTQQLDGLRAAGKSIDSPTALLRAGIGEFDRAIHAAMLSEPGLEATAAAVRATSRRRTSLQKLTALAAESLGQPTREEVDEAFREIQQLKRKVRQLERAPARSPKKERRA
jgi:hypothetical protein